MKQTLQQAVAEQLRRARKAAGWTQADLAKRMLVSQQQVAKLESPKSNPRLKSVIRAFDALGWQLNVTVYKRRA